MGLCSFGCCSGMGSLLGRKICIYICLYGSKSDGLLICFRSVTVSLMCPYSCFKLSILNGKFYCEVLRQLRENARRKRPEMWNNGK